MSIWLSSHLDTFGDTYRNADGTPDLKKIESDKGAYYGTYDTYMSLSVYNHLREMLGLCSRFLGRRGISDPPQGTDLR